MQHACRTAPALAGSCLLLGLVAVLSCRTDPITEPGMPLSAAKGGAGGTSVTVTAADPDTVPTDTTLTVRIYGSGFAPGTDANKVEYIFNRKVSTRVVATSVQYVSAIELSTTTRVARDAAIGTYDIAVTSNGKRGIGVERMEVVVRAVVLPDYGYESNAFDINDDLVAVGFAVDPSGMSRAVRWVPEGTGWRMEDLGPGMAIGINRWGDIVGANYRTAGCLDGDPARACRAWVRLAGGATIDLGPVTSQSSLHSKSLIRVSDDLTVLANYLFEGSDVEGMAVRMSSGSTTWTDPTRLPPPNGMTGTFSYAQDLSASGEWIGGLLQPTSGYQIPAGAWRRNQGTWTGLVVDPAEPNQVAMVLAVRNSGMMAGRVRSCNGPGCSDPVWTLVTWAAPGTVPVSLAGCVAVAFNRPLVTDMNEAGHIVGNCNHPEPQGRKGKFIYPVRQLFWQSPTAAPILLSSTGLVWAVNDTRAAAGRDKAQRTGYCVDPYESSSPDCHAVVWLLP